MCSIGYGEVCLVILADINVKGLCEEGLRSTAEFGVKESETIHWMPFPVTAEMVAGVIVGKIDVLVGNAGVDSISSTPNGKGLYQAPDGAISGPFR
jgi:hypothetical protein